MRHVLVRTPSARLTDGMVRFVPKVPVDFDLAHRQWIAYVETIMSAGWQAIVVPLDAPCPGGVFIEDLVFVHDDMAILTRPATFARRFEILGLQDSLEDLGYRVHTIDAPGTLEGGDLLRAGDEIYVGYGGRSNAAGIGQLRALLQPTGATIVPVPVGPAPHLKSAVTVLPDGSFIGYTPALSDPGLFPRFRAVPELAGSNVVLLGEDKVLMAANCPTSAALVAGLGFEVVVVDISEFQKREGDLTGLSVRLPEPAVARGAGSEPAGGGALAV